jgi:hypothetical protein
LTSGRAWLAAALLAGGCSRSPSPRPAASQAPVEPLKITQFYTTAPQVARGEQAELCYGVEHASTVWLSPPRQELSASISRCVEVTPEKTTTYTLTAENQQGQSAAQTVTVTVGPPKPPAVKIHEVTVTSLDVKRGDEVGICYEVENARAVTIEPGGFRAGAGRKGCTVAHPDRTTTYIVAATGAGGDRDQEKLTVKVR